MRFAKAVVECVGTAALVAALAALGFVLVGPRLGWETHPVLSGSMEPALPVGSVIVTRPVRLQDVRSGDIITFQVGSARVTHRVVEVVHKEGDARPWFRTKGDANEGPDVDLVTSKGEFIPKTVAVVPYVGYLTAGARNTAVYLALIGVPGLVLVGMLGRDLWRGIVDLRAERRGRQNKVGHGGAEGRAQR